MSSAGQPTTMRELVDLARGRGGLATDDVLGVLLPLLRSVAEVHAQGRAAGIRATTPYPLDERLRAHLPVETRVSPASPELSAPSVPDELDDVLQLGTLLSCLCCGLDPTDPADLARLAQGRANLLALSPQLHPVVSQVASSMTEPDRRRRSQDLAEVVQRLETYRDQPLDFDLLEITGGMAAAAAQSDRRRAVLVALRERLFDLSRRNRLIAFRPTLQSLNLTDASVPAVMDVCSIDPGRIVTWRPATVDRLLAGTPVALGSLLRWEDAPQAAAVLDGLIAQVRRDRAEYGQSTLRLVTSFLHWSDLKGDPERRITSPLVLLPVTLARKRGVRDSHVLQVTSTLGEVNPALRQYLKQLYDLDLPELVDLQSSAVEALHADLAARIAASEPAVQLTLVDEPALEELRLRALARTKRLRGEPAAPDPPIVNPYAWSVDLCSVTLATLNHRTMSLVRDVGELIDTGTTCAAFDRIFSLEPRPLDPRQRPTVPLPDRYLVVPADASQLTAIARARDGESLVIQGPPGTGKSQTITNLIADYVAVGKRVLFVSQKRAAIDVVHARLRQQGLDELTCLIHDSQADKKAFVHGLRATYESWLADGDDVAQAERDRTVVVGSIAAALNRVQGYEQALAGPAEASSHGAHVPSVRDLLERVVALRDHRWAEGAAPYVRLLLPSATDWALARPTVDKVAAAVPGHVLAHSPARFLSPAVLAATRPDAEAAVRGAVAATAVRDLTDALQAAFTAGDLAPAVPAGGLPLSAARTAAEAGAVVAPLAHRGRADAVRLASAAAESLRADASRFDALRDQCEQAARAAAGWHAPLDPQDAAAALEIALAKERSALRWFSGRWRRVRRTVRGAYDPGNRAVSPTVVEALNLLVTAQRTSAAAAQATAQARQDWGHDDPAVLAARLDSLRRCADPTIAQICDALARTEDPALADGLAAAVAAEDAAVDALRAVLIDVDDVPLGELASTLDAVADPANAAPLRALAPPLRLLEEEHDDVASALRRFPVTPDQLEHAVVSTALDAVRDQVPAIGGFRGDDLREAVAQVQDQLTRLYACDAAVVVARVRSAFLDAVAHSARPAAGMSAQDRELKRVWSAGRRELEHELGKTRAYRSIRELASGEPGAVVAALRPVWLMSPTSVSDTLPLDPGLFDVVVYDEASQIPVEEAVPAMHRAQQVIVVGDQMQLPPTQYFATRQGPSAGCSQDDGDGGGLGGEAGVGDGDEVDVGVVLDGDSFLAQSAERLASTMLTWHYRSRYEALIGFSNAAFYDSRLSTVPDRAVVSGDRPAISAEVAAADAADGDAERVDPAAVTAGVDALLGRSISLHTMHGAVYRRRTNPGEAAYIAAMVRELLRRETGLTIGIVAFSQAQQGMIEHALDELAETDPSFARLYEAEIDREDGDQAVGLFVKNLENVQGDERDVILMSVCYAPDASGRMLMNFGPINQRGGERRLNVIFSRARQHMAIVTTIDASAITNVYNDGANTLRTFLDYAAAVSEGDDAGSTAVLRGLASAGIRAGRRRSAASDGEIERAGAVAVQLGDVLREMGVDVAVRVGHSAFRADLALRRPGEAEHRIAVLVDTAERAAAEQLEERLLSHPAVLRAAGWQVEHVLTKDWCDDPQGVVDRLVGLVRG